MTSFVVKSFTKKTNIPQFSFFVLNKGLNSGKPLNNSIPNCFVVSAEDEKTKKSLFNICYIIWKSKSAHYYLRGSVIEFITLHDFNSLLLRFMLMYQDSPDKFEKLSTDLTNILNYEAALFSKIDLLKKLKCSMFHNYIKSCSV